MGVWTLCSLLCPDTLEKTDVWETMSSDEMKSCVCRVHAHTSVIPDESHFSAHQPFHPRELSSWLGRGECKLQASCRSDEKKRERKKRFQRGEEHGWWTGAQAKGQELEAAPFQTASSLEILCSPQCGGCFPDCWVQWFTDRAPVPPDLFEDTNGSLPSVSCLFSKKENQREESFSQTWDCQFLYFWLAFYQLNVVIWLSQVDPKPPWTVTSLSVTNEHEGDELRMLFRLGERGDGMPMALSHCRGEPWPCRWWDYFSKMTELCNGPKFSHLFAIVSVFPENLPGLS